MYRHIAFYLLVLSLGCAEQSEISTKNLSGSWGYLSEDLSYGEFHFNDSSYILQLENIGVLKFKYWIKGDTIFRADQDNSRMPAAIVKTFTKDKLTFENPSQLYQLERIENYSGEELRLILSDSLTTINSSGFEQRSKNFYKKRGIEIKALQFEEDDFEEKENVSNK